MTRDHADRIAREIPGARVESIYSAHSVQYTSRHFDISLPNDGDLLVWLHSGFIKPLELFEQLHGVCDQFSSAIAAAVADGFPDPRQAREEQTS